MLGMYTQAPAPGASGKFTNSEKLPSPRSGYGRREIPDLWSAPFKASPSLKALNSLLLVSSDALTLLAHYVHKLRSRDLEIAPTYCTIPRLHKHTARVPDCANVLCSLKIGCAISRLASNFGILRMYSAISRLRKFLDCAEHVQYWLKNH